MPQRIFSIIVCFVLIVSLFGYSSAPVVLAADEPLTKVDYPYAADHLIISFRPEVNLGAKGVFTHVASLDRSLESLNAVSFTAVQGSGSTYILELAKGADILKAVEILNADPAVEYAEPDFLAKFASAPDDPRYSEQWGLIKVQAEGAWEEALGSPSIVIAIIDSGIDLSHEDLAPNLWINPGEIAGNGLDDDNNGFIDDVQGWNFVDHTNNVQDYNGHGSLVAGVAAARTGNATGIAGVCGACRIMPVKVTQLSGFANYSDIAAGIYYAADKGARVINLSVGGYANSITVQNAINYALSKNIVIVAGAGNDNQSTPFYPAAYEGVIAVAGTDLNDVKVVSSNYGAWVDVSAPGQDVLSTTLGDYSSDTGTSYAAPFVSGAAGLLLSLHPEWTPAMIRSQFMHTTDEIDSLNPTYAGKLGAGRLNATTAIQPPNPILTYQSYTGNGTPNLRPDFGSTVTLNITLYNDWADASEVNGTLSSTDPFVTITSAEADFGTILAGQSQSNSVAFSFDIAVGAGYNHAMPFALVLSADGGIYTTTVNFTITTRSSEELVSGIYNEDTTWTSDKTYKVTGNTGIAPGFTLTIESGTMVLFAGNYSLNVGGTLIAQGTIEQPIRFEPYTMGGIWNRIYFADASTDAQATTEGNYQSGNILQYVSISGATGGITCASATPYLDKVTTDQGGVTCALGSSDLWMMDSTLTGEINISQGGSDPEHLIRVDIRGGNVTVPSSLVIDSVFAGNVSVGSASTIASCTITGGAISAGDGSTITHNNVQDSSGVGITASGNNTITFNRVVGTQKGIVTDAGFVENNLIANTTGNGLEPGSASVRNNTLIGIQGHGVYLSAVPAAFEYNNFEFNTGAYDVYVTVPKTIATELAVSNNWWGTIDSSAIQLRIYDYFDDNDFNLAKLVTDPLLTAPSQTAPGYVRNVTLDPLSPVGIQTVNFTVEFSRPMDVSGTPSLKGNSTSENTWSDKTNMPTARYELGAAVASNGKIYAIGGFNSSGFLSTVEEYDPLTDTWTTRASMPTARKALGVVAASNGRIYAIGGYNNTYLSTVEEYDPFTDTWTTKASMSTSRNQLGVTAANNGKIYVIGGGILGEATSIVEEYDPQTDTWTTKASMPTARRLLGVATATNGRIYAVGGYASNSQSTVEEYDPQTDTWTTKASMATERWGLGVVAASNGKIYAIGGIDGWTLATVEEYDPLTDTWTTKASMPVICSRLGVAAASNGRIYAIGGHNHSDFLSTVEEYTPLNWGLMEVNANPQWLDETHYRVSYDFSTLNPRGDYRLTIVDIMDSDGILIAPDNRTIFTMDYAGEISDNTPPSAPTVLAWGDGSLTQLTGRASALDPDSQIVAYRYAIGSTPGGTDVVNWANTASNEITHSGLSLQLDQAYYVSFTARNEGGLWSPVGVSNDVVNGAIMRFIYLPMVKK